MNQDEKCETPPPGFALRVSVSIVVLFGALILAIIYVAFFASSLSLFQKIAVVLVTLLAVIAILGVVWASWSIKYGREWKEKEH